MNHLLRITKKLIVDNKFFLILLAAVMVVTHVNPYAIALTFSLKLSYRLMRFYLSARLFGSKFFILIISIFFYIILLQALIIICWLVSHNASLSSAVLATFVALLSLYAVSLNRTQVQIQIPAFRWGDLSALIVVGLILCATVLLPLHNSQGSSGSSLISLINNSVDDANHIALLNDRVQFDRGVIYGSDSKNAIRDRGALYYPPGWHSANAAVIKVLAPSINTGLESLTAYTFTKIFWFAVLVFIFVRTIFGLRDLTSKTTSFAYFMWVTLSSTVIGILFLSDAFLQGFYSFLPQLTIVPLFILALVQISQANNDSSHQSDSLIFPILLCVGGALAWLLLLPVFALALLVVLVAHYKSIGIKEFTRIMTRNYSALLITILISILALGIQLYIFRQSDSGPSFINGVLLSGGINLYPITFYLVLCVGVALAFVYARARVDIIRPILYFASTLAVFITLIYLLQVYETQSTLYYYFKVLNTLTLLAAMVAILGFGFLIDKIQKQAGRGITIASIIIVLALGVQFIYTNPPIFAYAKGIRSMSNGTNQQVLELLKTSYSQSHYDTNEVTIFYPNNNPMLNEVAATLLKANKPYSDCYVGLKVSSMSVSVKDFSVEPINKYCGDEHISKITYLVDRGSQVQLQTTIEAAGLQDRVKVDLIRY